MKTSLLFTTLTQHLHSLMIDLHILLCGVYDFHHIVNLCILLASYALCSPFSIISYYFSFSHNLCFTAVVADQYLLMSVYEHWASCTVAELQLIHTSVTSSSTQTGLANYSWLRQGTVFCLDCLDLFLGFFPSSVIDAENRAVGHSGDVGKKRSVISHKYFILLQYSMSEVDYRILYCSVKFKLTHTLIIKMFRMFSPILIRHQGTFGLPLSLNLV